MSTVTKKATAPKKNTTRKGKASKTKVEKGNRAAIEKAMERMRKKGISLNYML